MEEILQYLEMKNQYYEKFYTLSKKFLTEISANRWDDLEYFVDNRERILSIIRSFDFQISKALESKSLDDNDAATYKEAVKNHLEKRSDIAQKIVQLDLELIARIDEYKSDTIRDLKKTVETQQHIDSFARPKNVRKTVKSA